MLVIPFVFAVAIFPFAAPAGAEVSGPCTGSATFQKGLEEGGPLTVTSDSVTDDVITVPRADTVAWTGSVTPTQEGEREISGYVALALPWPLGTVNLGEWDGPSSTTTSSGTETYDIPSLVPAGMVFHVTGEHSEPGVTCTGDVQLKIEGSPFDTIVTPVLIGITALLGGALVFAGLHGHGILGAFAGLGAFFFGSVLLALFGVVPTDSVVLPALPLAGAAVGGLWGGLTKPPVPVDAPVETPAGPPAAPPAPGTEPGQNA